MATKPITPTISGLNNIEIERIQRLLDRRKYSDAVYQIKRLTRNAPTPELSDFLWKVYVEAVEYFTQRDEFRNAHPLLLEMESHPSIDAVKLEVIARFRTRLGDWQHAVKLLEKLPDPEAPRRLLAVLADRAVSRKQVGRKELPTELHAGFDLVLLAFEQYDRGEDAKALDTLQGISVRSPFLDWKLLIRGLLAYSQGDDLRAIENWQRLTTYRLPYEYCKPILCVIDPNFRASLPPTIAARYQQNCSIAGDAVQSLRKIQRLTTLPDRLDDSLDEALKVAPKLRQSHPAAFARLANYFYWAIYREGEPSNLKHYRQAFGTPKDDPDFARLLAMVGEKILDRTMAHKYWQQYEAWIAKHPERWPGKQADYARAMIWNRMGENANANTEVPEEVFSKLLNLFDPKGHISSKVFGLQPPADDCFQRASKLAPTWQEPAVRYFELLVDAQKLTEAKEYSEELLKRFPNDLSILLAIAKFHQSIGRLPESVAALKRALQVNPLDRKIRSSLAQASYLSGSDCIHDGDLNGGEPMLLEAMELEPHLYTVAVKCLQAALRYKSGDSKTGNELLAILLDNPLLRLEVAYRMTVEGGWLKLPKPILKEYQNQFKLAIDGKTDPDDVFILAGVLERYQLEVKPYYGMQSHQKKIANMVKSRLGAKPPESELEKIGKSLLRLRSWGSLKLCADQGRLRYPTNPLFPYLLGEIALNRKNYSDHQVASHFRRALLHLDQHPGEQYAAIRVAIESHCRENPELDSLISGRVDFFDF